MKPVNDGHFDEQLGRLLKRDALAEAEEITGQSYKDDQGTMALGFLGHLNLVQDKRKALEFTGDTHFSMDLDRYLAIIEKEGFELALREPFMGGIGRDTEYNETLFVFFHPEGVVLVFDTYGGDHVNGGQFHYNVEITVDHRDAWKAMSSGGWGNANTFYGYHDCRVALRHNIKKLRSVGRFLNPWKFNPLLLAIVHYADKHCSDVHTLNIESYTKMASAKTLERAAKLPQYVQDCIAVSLQNPSENAVPRIECLRMLDWLEVNKDS